jgi:PIN domain nuclease of toxin-antitoxin system
LEFNRIHATVAADLKQPTRKLGLSLGDRACLALAITMRMTAVTSDRAWDDAVVPVEVFSIR